MRVQIDDVQMESASASHQYYVTIPIQSLDASRTHNALALREGMAPDLIVNNSATYDVMPYIVPAVPPTRATSNPISWGALLVSPLLIWVRPVEVLSSLAVSPLWYAALPIVLALLAFYTRDFIMVFLGSSSSEGEFVRGVFGILLGWPLCAGLLHTLSRTVRPQSPLAPIMALSAWALLPLAVRNLVELLGMTLNGEAVVHRGLSGLLVGGDAAGDITTAWVEATTYSFLSHVDLYTFLHLLLLMLTVRIGVRIAISKSALLTVLYALIMASAGFGILLLQQIS